MAKSETFDVVIVGAGISGIGMAAHLAMQCPGKSYVVLDRREQLGGTWDLFRYPGIRSDSDMYTFSYAFEPWQDDETVASADKIRAYLGKVVSKYGVAENMRFSSHQPWPFVQPAVLRHRLKVIQNKTAWANQDWQAH